MFKCMPYMAIETTAANPRPEPRNPPAGRWTVDGDSVGRRCLARGARSAFCVAAGCGRAEQLVELSRWLFSACRVRRAEQLGCCRGVAGRDDGRFAGGAAGELVLVRLGSCAVVGLPPPRCGLTATRAVLCVRGRHQGSR